MTAPCQWAIAVTALDFALTSSVAEHASGAGQVLVCKALLINQLLCARVSSREENLHESEPTSLERGLSVMN